MSESSSSDEDGHASAGELGNPESPSFLDFLLNNSPSPESREESYSPELGSFARFRELRKREHDAQKQQDEEVEREAEIKRLKQKVQECVEKICEPQPSKTKLKLKVNRITLTASWKWRDSKDDDACGICRGAFEACCTNCKMPGDGCPLALGDCKHPFHLHCINKWIESQSKPSCPLCRTEWKTAGSSSSTQDHSAVPRTYSFVMPPPPAATNNQSEA